MSELKTRRWRSMMPIAAGPKTELTTREMVGSVCVCMKSYVCVRAYAHSKIPWVPVCSLLCCSWGELLVCSCRMPWNFNTVPAGCCRSQKRCCCATILCKDCFVVVAQHTLPLLALLLLLLQIHVTDSFLSFRGLQPIVCSDVGSHLCLLAQYMRLHHPRQWLMEVRSSTSHANMQLTVVCLLKAQWVVAHSVGSVHRVWCAAFHAVATQG